MFLAFALACSPDSTTPTDGVPPAPEPDPLAEGLPQGEYLVGLAIAAVGGLPVPLHATVETRETADGPVLTTLEVRAVGDDDELSDLLVTTSDVPVTTDGFVAELPEFVLPADYSITGSDVAVAATLTAEHADADGFCGTVAGALTTFSLDLAGSTFAAIPWDRRAEGAETACGGGTVEEVPRLADCPDLVAGRNTLTSGGVPRALEVVLPASYDPQQDWPIVLVYHGFGGDIASMLDDADLRRYADDLGVILVVPQALEEGGSTIWDAFSDPRTNLDAVLFDDVVHCAQQSFSVDPARVHVTGMSNGGLLTGYLAATRADVIASSAPMSGGVTTTWIDTGASMPMLVVWGGEADVAFDQDFDLLAADMIDQCLDRGWFVAACDHGLGHTLDPSFWPWVLQFLLEHPRGVAPEPYAAGLPPTFPGYCGLR